MYLLSSRFIGNLILVNNDNIHFYQSLSRSEITTNTIHGDGDCWRTVCVSDEKEREREGLREIGGTRERLSQTLNQRERGGEREG